MNNFLNDRLTEYLTEYTLKYRKPKIYHGGNSFDLSKRWYVYYSFLNPDTGKMTRQPPIYFNVNKDYHTKSERLERLKLIRDGMEEILKNGFSPYDGSGSVPVAGIRYTCEAALDHALKIKSKEIQNQKTIKDYKSRVSIFKTYLADNALLHAPITTITRKTVNDFLTEMLLKSEGKGVKNRNNTKAALSSIFGVLEKQDIIKDNFVRSIGNLKHKPERHKTYDDKKVDQIFEWLKQNDPVLSLFIKLISFNFLRPIEVCRIYVKDIDLNNALISFRQKTKPLKYKRIPDIIIEELRSLDLSNPDHLLFTPSGPGHWDANELSRRDHFTKRYKETKDRFGLDADYSVYSFRHTFITRLYRNLRSEHSVNETLDMMMGVTGHESYDGLKNYLRDIDAEIPDDWSVYLKKKNPAE